MGKKIDFYGQVLILISVAALLISGIFSEGYLFGGFFLLLPLGLWQVISAGVHSYHPAETVKKPLTHYWKACAGSLIVFIGAFFMRDYQDNTLAMVIAFTGLVFSVATGIYYLYIYKKFLLNGKPKEEHNSAGSIA